MRKLIPSENKHFKDIRTGDIHERVIYLGIYDDVSNYEEVSEEEYQRYLKNKEKSSSNSNGGINTWRRQIT